MGSVEECMQITIWSLLAENAAGSLCISVSSLSTIGDLMLLYCSEKSIQVSSNYILCNGANKLLNATKTLKKENVVSGEILMLTTTDKKEENYSFSNWWMVICLSLFIGFAGLIYVFYVFLIPITLPEKHGIVIDAGSSHSHLFVFNWHSVLPSSAENLRIIHECYMSGGIAQYRSRTDELLPYFQQCLEEAKALVPQARRHNTPLILGATAGMRILRQYDPDGANAILSAILKIFNSETSFKVEENDVFIVSGQQEGIDAWTAVNYLFNSFWQDDQPDPYLSTLDLGGASVQVSTYIDEPGKWPTVNISLFNSTYSICSKSFLCYGIVKAHYRYEYLLANKRSNNSSSSVVSSPCLPSGITTIFTKRDVSEPCVLADMENIQEFNLSRGGHKERKYISKYINSYNITDYNAQKNSLTRNNARDKEIINNRQINMIGGNSETLYRMEGANDAVECRKSVRELFDYKLCNETFVFGDCLNYKHIPPYTGELVGFSSIFYLIFSLLGIGKDASLHKFEESAMETCSKDYTELRTIYPDLPDELIEDLCFDVMYVYTLLTEGLAITPLKWKNILFAKQVKNQDVVWALGLMLNRTPPIPLQKIKSMDITSFVMLTVLFSACLLTSVLFLFNTLKLKKQNSSYERVLNEYFDQQRT